MHYQVGWKISSKAFFSSVARCLLSNYFPLFALLHYWANSTAFSFMSRVLAVSLTFSDVMEVNPYRLVFVSHYSVNQIIIKNGGRSKHLAPNGD